ncbi:MAG TPA: shikimate kinase [Pyrinomonadaceae bacterium]|nr:shikimate kinase [Pyrinomonadaceae bacterium]
MTENRIALTGFMGVGKTSVARHLARILGCEIIDLDIFIEEDESCEIADLIRDVGIVRYREIETESLKKILAENLSQVVALGGGAWTVAENRRMLKEKNFTSIWLESTFEHCWQNIRQSKKERPLASNKQETQRLFQERQNIYCLADWHFIVRPDQTSFEVARQIAEEVFSIEFN